ncbi:MAG: hypothetical protein OXG08_11820 [Gammaproteobacteria bacterium]|nr:hypothetical protein [Gammaproteobacteria bacterium]
MESLFSGLFTSKVGSGLTAIAAHHADGGRQKYYSGTTENDLTLEACDDEDDCFTIYNAVPVTIDVGALEGGTSG